MSNLFEAVRKHGGEILEAAVPLLDLPMAPEGEPYHAAGLPGQGKSDPGKVDPAPRAPEPAVAASASGFRRVAARVAAPVLPFDGLDQRASEQYRMARTRLLHDPRQPRVIVVSSAGVAEGKTVTSINLAGALSLKSDCRVLLIDGDLRRSALHAYLGLAASPGLTEVLSGACELEEAVVQVAQMPNLFVLAAGEASPNPAEMLDSNRWRALVHTLREQFRFVVIDSPPIGVVADYDLLQAVSDGVIVVARPDMTVRTALFKAVGSISARKRLGVVVNGVGGWPGNRGDYGYGYRYAPREASAER